MALLTFSQAIQESARYNKRHALLGNGFSIACRPNIFAYGKLYEQADFSKVSPTAKFAFDALGTQDFEKVIKSLRDSAIIVKAYGGSAALATQLRSDADGLRELLVQTIASTHPSWPGDLSESEYTACRKFLKNFDTIYSLNYDLLLYWTQMHTPIGVAPTSDDGFRTPDDEFEAAYVTWEPGNSHEQNMWFLHGALHVFDTGTEIRKYTWNRTGIRLIDQIRDALKRNYFPLFVSEGTSEEKYERIRHSDYLAKAYRSFSEIGGALFIYGHSLAKNDDHYLKCIQKGKIFHLFIALYGDPNSDSNKFITRRAQELANGRAGKYGLAVTYFDAGSVKLWV